VVSSCAAAFDRVGMPEGQFHLAQAALYLAGAEKSNSTLGFFDALSTIESESRAEVPKHLRDASRDGEDLGHGQDYLYPHAYRDHWVAQAYLPSEFRDRVFYQPGELGWEGRRRALLAERRRATLLLEDEDPAEVWATRGGRSAGARWVHTLRTRIGPALEELGNALLQELAPSATDRILLTGDMVSALVPPIARSAPEGLTAVWTTAPVAERLQASFSLFTEVDSVDRPQIAAVPFGERPETPNHPGPFERILYRDASPADPEALLATLIPLLGSQGTLLLVETEPLEGTRPSSLCADDDALRERLEAIERHLFPPREALRDKALDRAGLRDRATVRRLETTTTRRIDEHLRGRWFGPESIYARRDGEAASAALEFLKDSPPREIEWTRVSSLIRITLA